MTLIKTIRITTRPAVDIPFFKWSEDFILYAEENFVNTNKILHYLIELSEDGLTETRTAIWGNEEYYMNFVHIGFNEWGTRENYNLLNGINSTFTIIPTNANSIEEILSVSPSSNLRN